MGVPCLIASATRSSHFFCRNDGINDLRLPLAISSGAGFSILMPRIAKPVAGLTKKDYELLAQFRHTLRKFLGFSEAAAIGHGITPQQYQVLLAIEGYPGRNWTTIGELAEQ